MPGCTSNDTKASVCVVREKVLVVAWDLQEDQQIWGNILNGKLTAFGSAYVLHAFRGAFYVNVAARRSKVAYNDA
jgi:hypothetical protein